MQEKIKILYLDTPIEPPGGGQKSLIEILTNLDTMRFEPNLFLANHSSFEETLAELKINYKIVKPKSLFSEIKKLSPQLIHCNSSTTRYTFLGALCARLRGIPFFWHVRVNLRSFLRDHIIYLLSSSVIAISSNVRDKFLLTYKTTVIFNGVNTSKFNPQTSAEIIREEFSIPKDAKVIATVGRFESFKGQDKFLDTAALILKTRPDTRFLIIGTGTVQLQNLLKQKTASLKIEKSVTFCGHQSDIENIMASIDILIHFSNSKEAFGRVIIEAMSCGKAVVTSNLGAMSEIISDGNDGILAASAKPAVFAEACLKLLSDSDFCNFIKTNARAKAVKNFDSSITMGHIANLYNEALLTNYGQML